MKTQEFDFKTDSRVIPNDPVELRGKTRDGGRMIVLDRSTERIDHTVFSNICAYFRPGDLLVLNDSYLLANTLSFRHGDASVQISVCSQEPDGTSIVYVKSEHIEPGLTLTSTNDRRLTCSLLEKRLNQLWKARFEPFDLLVPTLDQHGQLVSDTFHNSKNWKTAPQAYRSVYAKKPGSLNIPSAGLHFSDELLSNAVAMGVEIAHITLHVGVTEILAIRHISAEEIENHKVGSEYFEVGQEAAAQLNQARAEGRRVIAVGTTVMRTLESLLAAEEDLKTPIQARSGWTDLYIYPGFEFKVVDVLITGLHQPRSSHIVLTAAFASKEFIMRSYAEIAENGGYEFDMFGDSMLIV